MLDSNKHHAPDNVFSVMTHPKYFSEGRINLPREAIGPRGVNWIQLILSNAPFRGYVPVFLGKLMQFVIFQEVSYIPPPTPNSVSDHEHDLKVPAGNLYSRFHDQVHKGM